MTERLIKYLEQFVTEERNALFNKIIKDRTEYITVVLEDIYQPQNASAVLRTCDCFGIQNVHIIENENEYYINPDVALGSDKWIDLHYYRTTVNNTRLALEGLKQKGYQIVATTPHTNDTTLNEFDISKGKIALLFGTELRGLSQDALDVADSYLKIPMYGFTESFNISVSAAVILSNLTTRLRNSNIQWQLTEDQQRKILLEWLKKSIKSSDQIIKKYHDNN